MRGYAITILLCLLLGACTQQTVRVTELAKNRTHSFDYVTDGRRILLQGALSIDEKAYPVTMIYNGETTMLIRENGQCIEYDNPHQLLFGFVPPFVEQDVAIQMLDNGTSLTYRVSSDAGTSLVQFSAYAISDDGSYNAPNGTICVDSEEVYALG